MCDGEKEERNGLSEKKWYMMGAREEENWLRGGRMVCEGVTGRRKWVKWRKNGVLGGTEGKLDWEFQSFALLKDANLNKYGLNECMVSMVCINVCFVYVCMYDKCHKS